MPFMKKFDFLKEICFNIGGEMPADRQSKAEGTARTPEWGTPNIP